MRAARLAAAVVLLLALPSLAAAQVRISAFYGNTAVAAQGYRRNFIELFNAGATPVNIANWTVHYAPATSTAWQTRTITSGTIPARGHFLIALATSDVNTAGVPLPPPDFTVATTLSTSATGGKLALYSGPATNTAACPVTTNLVDFIGFGATADCRSPLTGGGPSNNAPAGSPSTVLVRTNLFQSVNPAVNSSAADFIPSTLAPAHLPRTTLTPAVVVDGSAGSAYGSAVAMQTLQTSAGDSTSASTQFADGSELDQLFSFICGGTLHMVLAGNLETGNRRIMVFVDSAAGGQATLRGDNAHIGRMGVGGDGGTAPGMSFPVGFAPDQWFSLSSTVSGLTIDYGTLPTAAAGTHNRLGTSAIAAAPDGVLAGGDVNIVGLGSSAGVRAVINNSNAAGVTAGTGAASGAGVSTGVELSMPLWLLGNPQSPSSIRVFAFIVSSDRSTCANQSLTACTQCPPTGDSALRDWSLTDASPVTVPTRAPTFTTHPAAAISQCSGASTTLSVAATDAAVYQWQQSTDGGATWTAAAGTGTATAVMTTSSAAVAGTRFRCVAVNACGQTVSDATAGLVLNSLPSPPAGTTSYSGTVGAETIMSASLAPGETADWYAGSLCTGAVLNTGATYAFVPPQAGVYQFTVRARNTSTGCTSSTCLAITLTAAPSNDTCTGAIPLTLNTPLSGSTAGATADHTISATAANFTGTPASSIGHTPVTGPGRDVVYRFTPPASGLYSIRVTGYPTSQNLLLYLATQCASPVIPDPTGGDMLRAANRTTSTGAEELFGLSLAAGVSYYIFVDDTGPANTGGPFTIEVIRCEPETEPNNTPAAATPYTLGDSGMEFTMSPAGEADFFALGTPEAGSRIFALIDGAATGTADTQLRLTNQSGTLEFDEDNGDVVFGASGFSSVLAGAVADGNPLFLRANLFSSGLANEPYRLYAVTRPPITASIAEVEPNDTPVTAQRSSLNYYSGATVSAADADLYAFTAYAGQMVMLGLDCYPNHTTSGVAIDGTLSLLDGAGAALLTVNGASVAAGDNGVNPASGGASLASTTPSFPGEALVYRVRTSGTYYARVTAAGAGPYLLSISTFPTPTLCAAGSAGCAEAALRPHIVQTDLNFLRHDSGDGGLSGCYQDFTAQSTILHRGLTYPITVTIANDTPETSVAAWIDWNQNFDLSDSGERLVLTRQGAGIYRATITAPLTASLGPIRMRLRVGEQTDSPCGQTQRGEVEDYTLDIQPAVPPPANDSCSTPTTLTCGQSITGSTLAATSDDATLPPACSGPASPVAQDFSYLPGVWYTIALPGIAGADDRTITLDTLTSAADTRMWVFTGTCGNLTCIAASDNLSPTSSDSSVSWTAIAGVPYRVLIAAAGPTKDFVLTAACAVAPAGDTCSAPIVLNGSSGSVGATLTGATPTLSPLPSCDTRGGVADIWFNYTAPCSGLANFETCGTTDTLLSLHDFCPTSTDTHQLPGACNDDASACGLGSRLSNVPVTAGAVYLIRVASADAASAAAAITLTWSNSNTPPTSLTSIASDVTSYCAPAAPAQITLTATGGSGSVLAWYAGTCDGTPIGTGSPLTISAPTETTTYRSRWESPCGVTACQSMTVTVLPAPTAPASVDADRASYCQSAAPATLTLTAVGGSGTSLEWSTGDCGGAVIGTTSPLTIPAPTSTTTYRVRWINTCGTSACASLTITVTPDPTSPSAAAASPQSFCSPAAPAEITLTASGGDHGELTWFADACGTQPIGTGSPLTIAAPTSTRTYFVRRVSACGSSACTPVTVTVNAPPTAPTAVTTTTPIICDGNRPADITLTATGGSGQSVEWFAGTCGSTPIGTGPALTLPTPTSTTTYFARWTTPTCDASRCASLTITVTESPIEPTSLTASTTRFCSDAAPASLTLTAIGGRGGTLEWFADACSGTPIGVGSPLTINAPTATTTYLARWSTADCGSSSCVSLTVTVDPAATPPATITADVSSYCLSAAPGTITLSATGGSGEAILWFRDDCGGPVLGTGPMLVLPAPTQTTTFAARWASDGCGPSACRTVTVTVQQAPTAAAGGPYFACSSAPAVLSGSASHAASIQWTTSGDGVFGDALALNTTYTPGPLELAAGQATLTLTALPVAPCLAPATSTVQVDLAAPAIVYVDDQYLALPAGTAVNFPHNGQPGPHRIGCNAVATISAAVNQVATGGQVMIAAGEYVENVIISRRLTLTGAGAGACGGPAALTSLVAADPASPALLITDAGGESLASRLRISGLRVTGAGIGVAGVRVFASADQTHAHFDLTGLVITGNGGPGLHLDGYGRLSDIQVSSSEFCGNYQGVLASATLALLDGVTATSLTVRDNAFHGMSFVGRASATMTTPTNITISNCTFTANGQSSDAFDGSGDVIFRDFNGNATLSQVSIVTTGRRPLAFIGRGGVNPVDWAPLGTVLLDRVVISGVADRAGCAFLQYTDIGGVTLTGLNLADLISSAPPFSAFATAGLEVQHSGSVPLSLGNTVLPCQGGQTAGYVGLSVLGPGSVTATCQTRFGTATTLAAKHECVLDAADLGSLGPVIFADPQITSEPTGGTICSGQPFSFTVQTAGQAPLSYQWYRGSTPVGPNSPTFTIPAATLADADAYTLVVSNECGSRSSATVILDVLPSPAPPTAAVAEPAAYCSSGAPATVTLSAVGGSGDEVQWFTESCASAAAPLGVGATLIVPAPTVTTTYFARWTSAGCGTSACVSTTVTVTPMPVPPASVQADTTVYCSAGAPTTITLQATGGSGDSLRWYTDACTGTPIGSGPTLTVPAPLVTTTYLARWESTGCAASACVPITITVNRSPAAPTTVTADIGGYCASAAPAQLTLTATGGAGDTLEWSTTCGGQVIGTGTPLTIAAPTVTTTYVARWISASCGDSACASTMVIVDPNPPTPTDAQALPARRCDAGSVTLSASAPAGQIIDWYRGSCGGVYVGSGPSINITAAESASYFARMRDIATGCESAACGQVSVTIDPSPTPPTSVQADTPSLCAGSIANITLSATGGTGQVLRWYAQTCGGSPIGEGTSLTLPAPTATTTYFARWESQFCGESACASVQVTVNRDPTATAGPPVIICANGVAALSGAVTNASASRWTTSGTGTFANAANPATIYFPSAADIQAGSVTLTLTADPQAPCTSSAVSSTVLTIMPLPVTPTALTTDKNNYCAGSETSISLSAVGGSGVKVAWFAGSCGGSLVASGTTVTIPAPTQTTTYFAAFLGPCGLSTCASITINVLTEPTAPVSVSASQSAWCAGAAPVQLTLTAGGGSGAVLEWFAGACTGTPIGTGPVLTIPAPTDTTTYFARWTNPCGQSTCASTTVTVRPRPVAPAAVTADAPSLCAGSVTNITLTAQGGSGDVLRWYADACGQLLLGEGPTLITAAPTGTRTFFARWETLECGASDCASTTISVTPVATAPSDITASHDSICAGQVATITLTATGGSGDTLEWFEDSCGGTPIGTGNPLTVASPAASRTYLARWSNACGSSTCASRTVTVNADVGACCTGWGLAKSCQLLPRSQCAPVNTAAGAYRGNCSVCTPTSCCAADYNNSGTVTVQDIFDFLGDLLGGNPPPTADFNNSGTAGPQDIFDFLAYYFIGC